MSSDLMHGTNKGSDQVIKDSDSVSVEDTASYLSLPSLHTTSARSPPEAPVASNLQASHMTQPLTSASKSSLESTLYQDLPGKTADKGQFI